MTWRPRHAARPAHLPASHSLAWTLDPLGTTLRVHSFASSLSETAMLLYSSEHDQGEDLPPRAVGPAGQVSFSTAVDDDDATLWRVDAATGSLELLTPNTVPVGPTLLVSPSGETITSLGDDDDPTIFIAWPTGQAAIPSLTTTQTAFVLPGR